MLWEEMKIHIVPLSRAYEPFIAKFPHWDLGSSLWCKIITLHADGAFDALDELEKAYDLDLGEVLIDAAWVPHAAQPAAL